MSRYKTHPRETSYYYSTCTITHWLPIFQKDTHFGIIIDSLKYCQTNKGLRLHGYVIMPTHLHLVTSTDDGVNFPGLMRDFKHFTASKIITILEEERHTTYLRILEDNATKRAPEQQHKVWQDGYHPVALTSERWFEQKLDYMHNNPVRKGFVEYPEHWKYSSARNWLEDDHSIIEIDKNA